MIQMPTNPTVGQQYVAQNTVTYEWTGDRWSAAIPLQNGTAVFAVNNGYADFVYDPYLDDIINGGPA
jgi:hypothetical protein